MSRSEVLYADDDDGIFVSCDVHSFAYFFFVMTRGRFWGLSVQKVLTRNLN